MPEILYIPEMARLLGKTETAIRQHAYRRTGAVPPAFRLGGQYAWHRADVQAWLDNKRNKAGEAGRRRGRGRPSL